MCLLFCLGNSPIAYNIKIHISGIKEACPWSSGTKNLKYITNAIYLFYFGQMDHITGLYAFYMRKAPPSPNVKIITEDYLETTNT